MRRSLFLAGTVALLITIVLGCGRKPENAVPDDAVIARVGDRKITAKDFLMSYQFFAHIPTRKRGFEAKKDQLDRVVQTKLFAQEAERLGLDRDTTLQKYYDWYRKKAAIRELYREEIESKIRISDEELRRAFVKAKTRIRARHLYARTYEEAERLLDRLRSGESFESLAREVFRDSTLANNGGDLGYFSFGDMDPAFEDAAYSLRKGEISRPVRSQYGWHIIQVTDIQQDVLLTESEYAQKKSRLLSELKRRKSARLSQQYVKNLLDPMKVTLKGKAFAVLAREFGRAFGKNQEVPAPFPFAPNMYSRELNQVSSGLEAHMKDTLLTFSGGYWTIGDFLRKLQGIPVTDRPIYRNPAKLRRDIGILFRDEQLAKIALDRGLDKKPEARREWQTRWDYVLYNKLMAEIVDTIQVTDEDVRRYYDEHPEEFTTPEMRNIREVFVRSRELAQEIYRRAKNGEDLARLAEQYSERPWAAKRGGEFGFFARGGHGEVGEAAFSHKVGDLVGPIEVAGGPPRGGYSVFRVIGVRPPRKVPFSSIKNSLKRRLLQERRERAIAAYTEKIKKEIPVEEYTELLKKIETIDDYGVRPIFLFPITNY